MRFKVAELLSQYSRFEVIFVLVIFLSGDQLGIEPATSCFSKLPHSLSYF